MSVYEQSWNWEQIGIDHMSGRILRQEEEDYLQEVITHEQDVSQDSQLMHDLLFVVYCLDLDSNTDVVGEFTMVI